MPRGNCFRESRGGSSNVERGGSSNIERGNQQSNETPEQRLARLRREGTQNLTTVRENRRVNETPGEQAQRVARERLCFLQMTSNFAPDILIYNTRQREIIVNFMQRECEERGIEGIKCENLTEAQVEELAKIYVETETIMYGEPWQSYERGVQVTYLWKLGDFPIVSRSDFPEKQEQGTCQSKSVPSFDQQSSK